MTERKSLSKKTRFEVFKRDSFTCQYCGSKAPDVILEIDHINPVFEGGENDLLNLITSCFACNRGKSKTKLLDNTIYEKQRAQIEELNLRRQQLEMLLEYRNELNNSKNFEFEKALEYYNSLFDGVNLSEFGEKNLSKLVSKFGLMNVLEALDIAREKYTFGNSPVEIANMVFSKIGGILVLKDKPEHIKKFAYIHGICKNKFQGFNSKKFMYLIKKCYDLGGDLDELQEHIIVDTYKNEWHLFQVLNNFIDNNTPKND